MITFRWKVFLSVLALNAIILVLAKTDKRQLKDIQQKIPMHLRTRKFCNETSCEYACPIDYELDKNTSTCRYKRSSCPPNYIRRHGSCVLQDVQCPPGSVNEGGRCIVRSFECPSGYVLEGSNCVNSKYCPENYHWSNGFCYHQQRLQSSCPYGYETRNGVCIQICVNCDAACAECNDESIQPICPAKFEASAGRCLRIIQGMASIQLQNITYKVPIECENDEFYSDGTCRKFDFVNPQCPVGYFYDGKCVEVAKCSKGFLQNDCECVMNSTYLATCRQGEPTGLGCKYSDVLCGKQTELTNGVCKKEISQESVCPNGVPFDDVFCTTDPPNCPNGYRLEGSICKREDSYPAQCENNQRIEKNWCVSPAVCDSGYTLQGDHCIKETYENFKRCPSGTYEDGEWCVSDRRICDSDYDFDEKYGLCFKYVEKTRLCPAGYDYINGTCVKKDLLCTDGFVWKDNRCVKESLQTECIKGQLINGMCVEDLRCPENYVVLDRKCVKIDDTECPEGSRNENGICVADKQCPPDYSPGAVCCVKESRTLLSSTIKPTCIAGFTYDNGNCIRITWRNATIRKVSAECPEQYAMQGGKCIQQHRGLLVCPPKTILMNEANKCFCSVDLVCPAGYERIGDECIFRSTNYYSSFLNFLNPCYGSLCGMQFCITQCFAPPCPVQACSYSSFQRSASLYSFANTEPCGGIGETCNELESVTTLICPPGYSRENNTCVGYYDRICQKGYSMRSGQCIKFEEVRMICPPGYSQNDGTCIHIQCDRGFTRDGLQCKKIEYQQPMPCIKPRVFIGGRCIMKTECNKGSIEGDFCVKREHASFMCPPYFIQHNESCIAESKCPSDSQWVDNVCRTRDIIPLLCGGTRWVGDFCIYEQLIINSYESIKTKCSGKIITEGGSTYCGYVISPLCREPYVLKNGRCIQYSTKTPYCPESMVIQNGQCISRRSCDNESYLNQENRCVSIHIRKAKCYKGKLSSGRCYHNMPSCKVDYRLVDGMCSKEDLLPASCSKGFLLKGKCVELRRCKDASHTLSKGLCMRHECSEPFCVAKAARTHNICIYGYPKCPDNHYMENGYCHSYSIQSAECTGNSKCSENFCHLINPSCTSPFTFDGSVCKQMVSRRAECPQGTYPDRSNPSYCQYTSQHAAYSCEHKYHFKNGICQKYEYVEASCPQGYRLQNNLCIRKSCQSSSLTNFCQTHGSSQTYPNLQPSFGQMSTTNHRSSVLHTSTLLEHSSSVCCLIISPRICTKSDEWFCSHTKNERCGPFCKEPHQNIHLRTEETNYFDEVLVVPPMETDNGNGIENNGEDSGEDTEDYAYQDEQENDCSPCTDGSMDCAPYCYTYDCMKQPGGCNFLDQREFCSKYPGPGCTKQDGCYDSGYCSKS
ncbi:neurogenic locus notch homolog protein 1-like [Uranotaenia lowii]|uniref:neurogenic locus notch homolog protein 1-like n=1 Tax=Uranotaenia lowii TaxID=190385 RepID=UPI00247A1EC4|nr:neurogenic locus notch homolog protein 1-like [Uranotaenia lowii]